ncbi:hypothetical protein [Dysgonomonas sp. 520]|uniref:hypothetical protein n=1 Tax=Dysgonomonas sp. 520 TaxID=2302931 RepID=UPI0013D53D45|nr:hypothetical protein [Dysgonomonas sp. 520]NDW09110.1 hypothetical protein [Dysgonomonas sp. 520]
MSKIYNIQNQEKAANDCSFDISKIENKEVHEKGTYQEILKIFKEAFDLIDITKIIKGLK